MPHDQTTRDDRARAPERASFPTAAPASAAGPTTPFPAEERNPPEPRLMDCSPECAAARVAAGRHGRAGRG